MNDKEFRCTVCGEVFENKWTPEEALEEARSLFTKEELEGGTTLVCTDCYNEALGCSTRKEVKGEMKIKIDGVDAEIPMAIREKTSMERTLENRIKEILKDVEEIHHWGMMNGNLRLMERTGAVLNKWQSGGMLERHKPTLPKIVCLCGSTKFRQAYEEANARETLAGKIVLSVGCFMHHDGIDITEAQKHQLDKLHMRKIDLADEVIILNVGGYIGESTANELQYARKSRKEVRFLEGDPYEAERGGGIEV
jgi:hypothetical protein